MYTTLSTLQQWPDAIGVNIHHWPYDDKVHSYLIKNVPAMVSVVRLHPETKAPLTAVMKSYAQYRGDTWIATFRLIDQLAIYDEYEENYIRRANRDAIEKGLISIVSIQEAKELEGKVFSLSASATTGDL